MSSPLITQLINAFSVLPGVGPKSAQRMAYFLLERNREGGQQLATVLQQAMTQVGHCDSCRTLCEGKRCQICSQDSRDRSQLCIVESPIDVMAIEQAGSFKGLYFVLMGHLSPIDGIGPEDIGVEQFKTKLQSGEIKEVILATNSTVEGEATAYYLAELTRDFQIPTTRIAHGVPMGGELEYIDRNTLAKALAARAPL